MNIVASNCIGARLYQRMNIQYNNPFMWHLMYMPEYNDLCKNWNNINFNNISDVFYVSRRRYNVPTILLDNKYNLCFTHHYLDKTRQKPLIKDINMYYAYIDKYLIDKYYARLKRMTDEPPIFIYDEQEDATEEYMISFINIDSPNRKILITKNENLLIYNNTNNTTVYIKHPTPALPYCDTKDLAAELIDHKIL